MLGQGRWYQVMPPGLTSAWELESGARLECGTGVEGRTRREVTVACALKDGGDCHAEMAEGSRRQEGGEGVKVGEEEVKGLGMVHFVLIHTHRSLPTNPHDTQKVLASSDSNYL